MMDKYPLTVRLDDQLFAAVKARAAQTRASLGSVVVDAARQSLLPEYREKQEEHLGRAMDRCFNRLVKLHEDQQSQHELLREMLALFVRTFLRHIPAVKPEHKDAAWANADKRFESFLDVLAANRQNRLSVMDPAPAQESPQSPAIREADRASRPKQPPKEIPPVDPTSALSHF